MTSRTHDNFRNNFWTMFKKTALLLRVGFPNCPSRWSLYLSLPLCVVHHSNRENGITAMYKLVIALVRVVILVILTAMLVVKPTWEAHSQLPVEAEKRSPVRGNKQSYSSALLFTSFIWHDVELLLSVVKLSWSRWWWSYGNFIPTHCSVHITHIVLGAVSWVRVCHLLSQKKRF